MTALATRTIPDWAAIWPQSTAAGRHALTVVRSVECATVHARNHASDWRTLTCAVIEDLAIAHGMPNWDGHGAKPISLEAKHFAQAFINLLPFNLPVPDPVADPDGDVALSWDFGPGHVMTLTIGSDGNLCYAVLIGEGGKRHGMEPFNGRVPEVVRKTIEELRDRSGAS